MLSDLSQIPSLQVTSVGLELREFNPRDGASHDQTVVKVRPRGSTCSLIHGCTGALF